jgi:hypothetical protein
VLRELDDGLFSQHVNKYKNEISEWVESSLGKKELSKLLIRITDKDEMRNVLLNHIISDNMHK